MSVEAIAIALHHSRARGTAKIILIGIANHDGDGGSWPSLATLAHYAQVHHRNAQRAVLELVELGEIRRHVHAGGSEGRVPNYRRPNRYDFLLECPPTCDRTRWHRTFPAEPDPLPENELSTGVALAPPHDEYARRGVALAPPETYIEEKTYKTKKLALDLNARASCGHRLIDDRHCEYGCAILEPP